MERKFRAVALSPERKRSQPESGSEMRQKKRRENALWVFLLVIAILAVGVAGYFGLERKKQKALIDTEENAIVEDSAEPEAIPEPSHPIESAEVPVSGEEAPAEPEPTAAAFVVEFVRIIGEDNVRRHLNIDEAVRRIVASIDNIPRENIVERLRPWHRLPGGIQIEGDIDSGNAVLSQSNFQRYNGIVSMILAIDTAEAVSAYKKYYPLFQAEYEALGYPDAYFNDRCVEVIDHLLATPEDPGPLRLVRPHVLYEYADPRIEQLSGGQKILLRAGAAHARKIKAKLREFRNGIAADDKSPG